MISRRLSKAAIQHATILNFGVSVLKVRNMEEVTKKAIKITQDKKILNQKRKVIAKVQSELDSFQQLTDDIFPQLNLEDLNRIRDGHTVQLIQQIPEATTNPEILALYLLFINFNDDVDKKIDSIFNEVVKIDFMKLIITISEEIGLEKDISDNMYLLAEKLIKDIRK